ncbi:hypothetical protein B0H19DRAFT_1124872 [Mycena capillaripes]|nr:hypothetical protein B0H19DRAFT_1124872 [Mycena capillaripes]
MSLSSYIKRQTRVIRKRTAVSSAGLSSILEEPSSLLESIPEKKPKKNSMKAKRRLGVPNLSIPHTSPLFIAVQGLDDSEWRLRLAESLREDGKDVTTFDIPRPPIPIFELPNSDESESSGSESSEGSRSGSESPMSSGMPTTPTSSPTAERYVTAELKGQCVIRCKSIKPLAIAKRSVSPIPPVPSSSIISVSSASQADSGADEDEEDSDAWQDDDEYYAAHAGGFITLAPPLPPSFPSSPALPRRESRIILAPTAVSMRPSGQLDPAYAPHRASVRLSRAFNIPTRAPPPPPIITSGSQPRSGSLSSTTRSPSSSSSSSSRLAALLSPSPPTQCFPAEAHVVPSDVDVDDDGEWKECTDDFDEVPLSPLVVSAPSAEPGELSITADDLEKNEIEEGEKSPLPAPGPYTGWRSPSPSHSHSPAASATPALGSRWSATTSAPSPRPRDTTPETPALRSRWSASTSLASPRPQDTTPETPALRSRWSASTTAPSLPPTPAPALRSRWSSSTLSSIHSAHARSPASPKTFSFARRYFPKSPKPKSPHAPAAYPKSPRAHAYKAHPRPMGSATVLRPRKQQRKLTVADVMVVCPPPAPSVLACASPDLFASFSALSPGAAGPPPTPYSASAQWAAYPASPAPAPALQSMVASTPSPALYAAYTTQRSPRRRASNASNVSGWSYSAVSASGSSESGHSECSVGSNGLRRKPIPVEMFLR